MQNYLQKLKGKNLNHTNGHEQVHTNEQFYVNIQG